MTSIEVAFGMVLCSIVLADLDLTWRTPESLLGERVTLIIRRRRRITRIVMTMIMIIIIITITT